MEQAKSQWHPRFPSKVWRLVDDLENLTPKGWKLFQVFWEMFKSRHEIFVLEKVTPRGRELFQVLWEMFKSRHDIFVLCGCSRYQLIKCFGAHIIHFESCFTGYRSFVIFLELLSYKKISNPRFLQIM